MESTAYNDYLRTDVLHSLQREVSELDGERSFIVVCQVQELFYGLISHELRTAIEHLKADRFEPALACLDRAQTHFTSLNASWHSLTWMLPSDFRAIKEGMTTHHGRSSSLQSWTFRHMLHLMGVRDPALVEPVKPMTEQYEQLQRSLTEPSVYDEVLDALKRAGMAVPTRTTPISEADPAIAAFWSDTLAAELDEVPSARNFVPALLAIAEGLAEFRHLHYLATRRTLGARTAYYGVSGVEWLTPTLTQVAFPDLWEMPLAGEETPA